MVCVYFVFYFIIGGWGCVILVLKPRCVKTSLHCGHKILVRFCHQFPVFSEILPVFSEILPVFSEILPSGPSV